MTTRRRFHPADGDGQKALRGFTLIELLVVVAIISLLVSILLPSLNGAKELARTVVCLSNLRSIGTGALLYTEDDDRRTWPLPWMPRVPVDPGVSHGWPELLLWPEVLRPYCGDVWDFNNCMFICPTTGREQAVWRTSDGVAFIFDDPDAGLMSYTINGWLGAIWELTGRATRQDEVPDPHNKILFGEVGTSGDWVMWWYEPDISVGYVHSGKAHLVFFDGHVGLEPQFVAMETLRLGED